MDDLLQQGITAYKAGKRDEARKIFISAVKQSPDSELAWGWMYQVSNNDQERIHCLKQILRINPKSIRAKQLLDTLAGQDFPFEKPPNIQAQKNNVTQVTQTEKSAASQKTPLPSQQKNLLVGIGTILFVCFICVCAIYSPKILSAPISNSTVTEEEYASKVYDALLGYSNALSDAGEAMSNVDTYISAGQYDSFVSIMDTKLVVLQDTGNQICSLPNSPSSKFDVSSNYLKKICSENKLLVDNLYNGIHNMDSGLIDKAMVNMQNITSYAEQATISLQ